MRIGPNLWGITDEAMAELARAQADTQEALAQFARGTEDEMTRLARAQADTEEKLSVFIVNTDEKLNAFISAVERLVNERGREGKP